MTIDREYGSDSGSEKDIAARLIRTAGRREAPPVEAYERSLRAATSAWQAKIRRRGQVMLAGWIAAGFAVAGIALLVDMRFTNRAPAAIADIDRTTGTVEWRADDDAAWSTVAGKPVLTSGGTLRTRDGLAAFTLDGGVHVRLAQATEVSLDSASRISVLVGQIYVDTRFPAGMARRVEVATKAGTAWDLGTQFEVLYRDETYRLRVREGRVVLQRGDRNFDNRAGDQILFTRSGELHRERIDVAGAPWAWAESLALAPIIEERPLTELLDWVSRETGRQVRFASLEVKSAAAKTILHGTLSNLAPLEALAAVLATTDFEYALPEDGTILIRSKSDTR